MALTLLTNPVGSAASKVFAGFLPVKFLFKREDLEVDDTESGTGGVKINISSDLTSYLSVGDAVYIYSEGTNYTYDGTGTILEITAIAITIDIPFIEVSTGGYINYFKNYYVELQCVNPTLPDVNLLPFSLQSDGDSAGNISVDVTIVNDLNSQRGVITEGHIPESVKEFEVKYRQVYEGSSESFTLINNKLIILLYATKTPESEIILNQFDSPKLYLGYPAALVILKEADPASSKMTLIYKELDLMQSEIDSGSLTELDSDVNGFILWKWPSDVEVNEQTKYIEFNFDVDVSFDFAETDFAYPDFLTE